MKRTIAFLAMSVMLTACGSATDSVTFQAPPAYKSAVSIGPFGQVWQGPNHSMIMLMALPTKIDLDKSISTTPYASTATVEHQSKIEICSGQKALAGSMIGNVNRSGEAGDKKDVQQEIEFLATIVNGKTYMALYARPKGTAADTSAEAAIHNVCPK